MSRLLILDASISTRVARELKETRSARGLHGGTRTWRIADDALLRPLAERDDEWVLVAADDKMPFEHPETVKETGATIATVDGAWKAFCQRHASR